MSAKFPVKRLSKFEREIFSVVREKLPENRFLVGGFVRDILLNVKRNKLDLDIVSPLAIEDAKILSDVFHSTIVELDEVFGIYRVPVSTDSYIDIAQIKGDSLIRDLELRDFTINAIGVDLARLDIFDPLGGVRALERKELWPCNNFVFQQDPVRILRAFSLSAQFKLSWKGNLEEQLLANINSLTTVKKERVNQELKRLFCSANSYCWLRRMYELGVLFLLVPEAADMEGLYQGPYHHLDVLEHSFETLRRIEYLLDKLRYISRIKNRGFLLHYLLDRIGSWPRFALLKWSAFWHDVGKPLSLKYKANRVVFYGHNSSGAKLLKNIMERLKFSKKQIRFACMMLEFHLRPGDLTKDDVTKRAIYKFFRQAGGEELSVLLLSWADAWATRGKLNPWKNFYKHRSRLIQLINMAIDMYMSPKLEKLIDGYDVMKLLKIEAGPKVGQVLEEIKELQLLGKLSSRKEALDYIRDTRSFMELR